MPDDPVGQVLEYALAYAPSPALRKAKAPTFADWLGDKFNREDVRAIAAARLLLDTARSVQHTECIPADLVYSALRACFAACHYSRKMDTSATNRAARKGFDKHRRGIREAAGKLANAISIYPGRIGFALPLDVSIRRRSGPQAQNPMANLQFVLQHLADNIDDLAACPDGAKLATVEVACLRLQPSSKVPDVETALLFNLVFLFRRWTAGQPLFGGPQTMPMNGRPCWPTAAALAALSLRTEADAHKAQRLVTSLMSGHNRVTLRPWPDLMAQRPVAIFDSGRDRAPGPT